MHCNRVSPLIAGIGVALAVVGIALAHDGHESVSGKQVSPRHESPSPIRLGREPNTSHLGGHPHFDIPLGHAGNPNRKQHDVRKLAFRLEYAAEMVSDEIRVDLPPTLFRRQLLASSADLEVQATHFRESAEKGVEAEHLRADLEKVVASFQGLTRSLGGFHSTLLIDRALFRVDHLLTDSYGQLQNEIPASLRQSPAGRQPLDARDPARPPEAIPEAMKDLALLPAVDQAAALAQKTCPVTGDLLGSLGKPFKVRVGERTVFVCCEGCVSELRENPDKFLTTRLE